MKTRLVPSARLAHHPSFIPRGRYRWAPVPAMMRALLSFLFLLAGSLSAQGPEADGAWARTTLVEELRIGALEGEPGRTFGRIDALAVGNNGTIFVYDGLAKELRRYGDDGGYLGLVARDGEGPGEVRSVQGMDVTPDGELAVWDAGNGRITIYDGDGDYRRDFRVASGLRTSRRPAFLVDDRGRFFVLTRTSALQEAASPSMGFLILSSDGAVVDTLALPEESGPPSFVLMSSDGQRRNFPGVPVYGIGAGGSLIVGDNVEYTIELRDEGGRVRRITRPYEPVPLKRGERDEWRAIGSFFERRGRGDVSYDIPSHKPAFRDIQVDREGRLWVERYVEAEKRRVEPPAGAPPDYPLLTWREPTVYDVFDADTRLLGTLRLPAKTVARVYRGRQIWAVQRGEFDEQYIVRFRIEAGQ